VFTFFEEKKIIFNHNKKGDKREIIVPYNMAFGNRGTDKITGGLTLKFEVELIKIYHSADLADLIVENQVDEQKCKRKSKKGDILKM
jgi:FKBP-type peptidyl-prolyl cis-trans isomerase 2